MPSSNFIRKYQLYIGFPKDYYKVPIQPKVNVGTFSDVFDGEMSGVTTVVETDFIAIPDTKEGREGILIEDLRVVASVKGSAEGSGSDTRKCEIKVYNLSADTRNKISQKGCVVIFKAGYLEDYEKDSLPIIASGQIGRSLSSRSGADVVTTLQVIDGYTPHTTVKINTNLPSNYITPITARDVLDHLIDIWKVNGVSSSSATIDYDFALDSVKFYSGWVGVGYLKDVMDTFCESVGLEWFTTNSNLYVRPKGGGSVKDLFSLNELNLVEINNAVAELNSSSESSKITTVSIKTFLDGRIKEGSYVNIEGASLSKLNKSFFGTYKVKSVTHTFDSDQGKALTEMIADKV